MKNVGGLDKRLLEEVVRIITSHKAVKRIVLYGSRAGSGFQRTSDIDLAIVDEGWTPDDINIVKFNLDEHVPTPLKFDVVLFHALTKESLKQDIREEGVAIYES